MTNESASSQEAQRPQALPPHPFAAAARRQLALGGAFGVFGILAWIVAGVGATSLAVASMALGGFLAYLAILTRATLPAIVLNNRAHDLITRGHLLEAEALLDAMPSRGRGTVATVARAAALQRALIAVRRGDPKTAERLASSALEIPVPWLVRDAAREQDCHALAVRAFARASLGDADGALADAAAVRASTARTPEALARVVVAEAILHARRDDREALGELLRRSRGLVEHTAPRERALLRSFQRMVRGRGRSIYRESAKPLEPAGEPALGDWVAAMAPEASAFFFELPKRARTEVALGDPAWERRGAGDEAASVARAGSARFAARSWRRRVVVLVGLWVVLVGFFVTIWQILDEPHSRHSRSHAAPMANPLSSVSSIAAFLFIAVGANIVLTMLRMRRGAAAVRRALLASADGDVERASAELTRLARARVRSTAATACLHLATFAERSGAWVDALAHVDRGLAKISATPALRAVHSDILVPELIAERAVILALQGRADLADAELSVLSRELPSFPFMARAQFRVRMIEALRRGDRTEAARIAAERTLELPLSRRDEMLADLVAATSGEPVRDEEVQRIRGELADDAELASWIDAAAPGLRSELGLPRSRVAVPGGDPLVEADDADAADATDDADKRRRHVPVT